MGNDLRRWCNFYNLLFVYNEGSKWLCFSKGQNMTVEEKAYEHR